MIVDETKLFAVTVSFGSVISLISLPCFMSHASIPAEVCCSLSNTDPVHLRGSLNVSQQFTLHLQGLILGNAAIYLCSGLSVS